MIKLDRALDIVFVIVCVVFVGILVARGRGLAPSPLERPSPGGFVVGESLTDSIPARFEQKEQTLLVVVNSGCKFCTESMPFYKRIQTDFAACPSAQVKFVSREPQPITAQYLKNHGIESAAILAVTAEALKGSPYPTMLLADRRGEVIGRWIGFMNEAKQQDLYSKLRCAVAP